MQGSIGTTTITPAATSYTAAADLPVSVVNPGFTFNNFNKTLSTGLNDYPTNTLLNVNTSVSGAYYSGNQATAAAISVTLVSAAPDVGSITPLVTLNTGAITSGSATITALSPGTTTFTASAPDFNPATSATLTVVP